MTKAEFLARCENAWDCGVINHDRLRLMSRWLDFVLRLEGGQLSMALDFLVAERKRNGVPFGTPTGAIGQLASDKDGYALQEFAAILTHHCQKCATDPSAWWTRTAFCKHKED